VGGAGGGSPAGVGSAGGGCPAGVGGAGSGNGIGGGYTGTSSSSGIPCTGGACPSTSTEASTGRVVDAGYEAPMLIEGGGTDVHRTPYPRIHPPIPQLPQSCSSPPAAASSSLHPNSCNPSFKAHNHSFKTHTRISSPLKPDRINYPINTFYGLPLTVKKCLEEHRGITKLYGIAPCMHQ
jgi:hypothetical protein